MSADLLPGQITNTAVPRDQDGELIRNGGLYLLGEKPFTDDDGFLVVESENCTRVRVMEDPHGDFWVKPVGDDFWSQVESLVQSPFWWRLDE